MNRIFKKSKPFEMSSYSVFSTDVLEVNGVDSRHIFLVQTPFGEFGYMSSANQGRESYLQLAECSIGNVYPYFENREFGSYFVNTKDGECAVLDLVRTPVKTGIPSRDLAKKIAIIEFHLVDARGSDEI